VRYAGAFSQPFYLTIANGYMSVPSASEAVGGYVTIIRMGQASAALPAYYTISAGLQGPISAVVGSLPHQ
jgi:hypothetical protein